MAYAELLMGTALGGLPYKQKARITFQGKSVVAEKLDIGAGGAGCGGLPRSLDLWYETANAIGFTGLGVCQFELVDASTPTGPGGSSGAGATPAASIGDTFSNITSAFSHLIDPNWWKRVGLGVLGLAVLLIGFYFAMPKNATGLGVAKQLTENIG
jgi:hypothetical protein